jgi:hypothetical protein
MASKLLSLSAGFERCAPRYPKSKGRALLLTMDKPGRDIPTLTGVTVVNLARWLLTPPGAQL